MNTTLARRLVATAGAIAAISACAAPALAAPDSAVAPETAVAPDTTAQPEWTGERATATSTFGTYMTCELPVVSPLLSDFGDDSLYFHAPGGDFETLLTGWRTASAKQVFGQAPFGFGLRSLTLAPGGWAITPRFCIDDRFPHFRFSEKGGGRSKLEVDVIYPLMEGSNVRSAYAAVPSAGWSLSPQVALEPHYGGDGASGREVALRFRATGASSVTIDDVLVDPKLR